MGHKTPKISPDYAVPCSSFSRIELEQSVSSDQLPDSSSLSYLFLDVLCDILQRKSVACRNPYYTVCIANLLDCKSRHGLRCYSHHQFVRVCAKSTPTSRSLPTSTASCCMSSLYSRGEPLPSLIRHFLSPTISADLICAALMLAVQLGRHWGGGRTIELVFLLTRHSVLCCHCCLEIGLRIDVDLGSAFTSGNRSIVVTDHSYCRVV